MRGCDSIWFRCVRSSTKRLTKKWSLPLLFTPPGRIHRRKNACVRALQKFRRMYLVAGPLP